MNQNIIDFYQTLRNDEAMLASMSRCETVDQIMEIAVEEGAKLGFHFSKEEAMAAGMDIDTLRASVMNDDELNDFELELISAGLPINCSSGAVEMQ